ncbi:monooxygenase [Actinoallomurus sp. NPDC052308]|uniref:monooxygenase n=1 Tax=Actinoallomurus sp. NPDC052308 TaxID=3155530 RepID=UPI003417FA33
MTLMAAACGSNSTGSGSASTAGGGSQNTSSMHMTSSTGPALPLRAGERFENLTVPQPYTPSAPNGGTDEYRCLVIDPHLTKPAFLTGAQFEPGNPSIVHHAITYAIPPQGAAEVHSTDAATPGQGWTCFGGTGLSQDAWVDTWTPNHKETLLKQDVGFPLKPGSLIVLQIHYNLLAINGRAGASDQSSIRLRLTDGTAATKPLMTVPLQAPIELPCASGESGPLCDRAAAVADVAKRFGADQGSTEAHLLSRCSKGKPVPGNTQHCDYPVPQPMTVYAGLGHMHLLGRSIKIELNPGTPKARILLDVPSFNFDNQALTPEPTPVDVKPGDKLRVTCTHDATLRQKLPQLSKLPPRYVVWGDGTSDEMCLGLLTVSGAGGNSLG